MPDNDILRTLSGLRLAIAIVGETALDHAVTDRADDPDPAADWSALAALGRDLAVLASAGQILLRLHLAETSPTPD